MDIHLEETKLINNYSVKFIFFNINKAEKFNPKYVKMINNSKIIKDISKVKNIYIIDRFGNEYKIKKNAVEVIGGVLRIKDSRKMDFMYEKFIKSFFLNNGMLPNTVINEKVFNSHIKKLKIIEKEEDLIKTKWNIRNLLESSNYSVMIIINKEIVGIVKAEILSKDNKNDFFNKNNISYDNLNLYISNVDIRPDFQGYGLCRPMLSFMIKNLKKKRHEMLFIYNDSRIMEGIPACRCYYKAGIENGYKLRYNSKKFTKMKLDDCLLRGSNSKSKKIPRDYFYV